MLDDSFSQPSGLVPVTSGENPIEAGTPCFGTSNPERQATISELLTYYFGWGKVELNWSDDTLHSYADAMRWIIRWVGDIPPQRITPHHVLLIKAECAKRGVGPSRVRTILAALKSFLRFCQLGVGLSTMDATQIRGPKIRKTEVLFLTPEEVQQFLAAIPIRKGLRTFDVR